MIRSFTVLSVAAALVLAVAGPSEAQSCKGTKVWCKTLKRCAYADSCPKAKAKTKARPRTKPRVRTKKASDTCPPDMVRVPAGSFVMGEEPPIGDADEAPKHQQETEAYCIDRTEVTVAAYVRNGGRLDRSVEAIQQMRFMEQPVCCVTWAEASAYCAGLDRRLPTEIEWERAARGDVGARYPWGESPPTCDTAIMGGAGDGCGELEPAGSRPAGRSPHGALDMVGSLTEWVADWYAPRVLRSVRGGSWASHEVGLRPSDRDGEDPETRDTTLGFRCAR